MEFLNALSGLGNFTSRGYFINSCYAHCQTEMQETWLRSDSPVLDNKVITSCQFHKYLSLYHSLSILHLTLSCDILFYLSVVFITSISQRYKPTIFLFLLNSFLMILSYCSLSATLLLTRNLCYADNC